MTVRVVYLAGAGRSGSTLLAQCLAQASGAVHVGEVRYLWQRGVRENHLCECGEPFDRCDFWVAVLAKAYGDDVQSVAAEMIALGPQVDRMRRIPQTLVRVGHDFREYLARFGELLVPLYDAIASVSGADLVLDSSKDPSYLFALAALDRLELQAVHLVRDSRAVAYSWTRKRLRPEIHWQDEYMNTRPPWLAAVRWLENNGAIELFKQVRRGAVELRYEDFAREPDQSLDDLRRALGAPRTEPGVRVAGHSLSGNPMRFDRGPLVVRPDVEWVDGLPVRDRRIVTAITAPLLLRYRYALRAGGRS